MCVRELLIRARPWPGLGMVVVSLAVGCSAFPRVALNDCALIRCVLPYLFLWFLARFVWLCFTLVWLPAFCAGRFVLFTHVICLVRFARKAPKGISSYRCSHFVFAMRAASMCFAAQVGNRSKSNTRQLSILATCSVGHGPKRAGTTGLAALAIPSSRLSYDLDSQKVSCEAPLAWGCLSFDIRCIAELRGKSASKAP